VKETPAVSYRLSWLLPDLNDPDALAFTVKAPAVTAAYRTFPHGSSLAIPPGYYY